MHKDPVSLIPLRAFADVFPFSPPNRPSPPCIPPVPSVPVATEGPTLGFTRSLLPPHRPLRSPVTARRHVHVRIHQRTRARNDPRVRRALCTVRDGRTGVATLPGSAGTTDEIVKRVVAKLRCYTISNRFPAEARDLPSLFCSVLSRKSSCVHVLRITIVTIYWPKPSRVFYLVYLIFLLFSFILSFLLSYEIRSCFMLEN